MLLKKSRKPNWHRFTECDRAWENLQKCPNSRTSAKARRRPGVVVLVCCSSERDVHLLLQHGRPRDHPEVDWVLRLWNKLSSWVCLAEPRVKEEEFVAKKNESFSVCQKLLRSQVRGILPHQRLWEDHQDRKCGGNRLDWEFSKSSKHWH